MGFHICEYVTAEQAQSMGLKHADRLWSSGDVTLGFSSGNLWILPDMAPLYIELGWLPPFEFIEDVLHSSLTGGERFQTRGMPKQPVEIGYLSPKEYPLPLQQDSGLPTDFADRLANLMVQAAGEGNRAQTKGLDFDNLR